MVIGVIAALVFGCSAYTYNLGSQQGFSAGSHEGYLAGAEFGYVAGQNATLADVQKFLESGGFVFNAIPEPDGSYNVTLMGVNKENNFFVTTASVSAATFNVLNTSFTHVPPKITTNIAYEFEIADGAGVKDIMGSVGNLITDTGDQYLCSWASCGQLNATARNGTVYIALGNGTSLAYSDTKLTAECSGSDTGFKRSAALTPTFASGTGIGNGNYYNFTIQNKFTATQVDTINATSAHWSGVAESDNNMMNEGSIGTLPVGQAFAINDNCTITITFTFQH